MLKYMSMASALLLIASCGNQNEIEKDNNSPNIKPVQESSPVIQNGDWIGRLVIDEDNYIPFNFNIQGDSITISNGPEMLTSMLEWHNDTCVFEMPVFETAFRFTIENEKIEGIWANQHKGDYTMPFKAWPKSNQERFSTSKADGFNFSGTNWKTTFSPNTEDAYPGLGIFEQEGSSITGTFLTETGDYRYLEGTTSGDSIYLSCFDGSHAFMFKGKYHNDSILGFFHSGKHWKEPFAAVIDPNFQLEDPYEITKVVDGQSLQFSLPDLEGKLQHYPDSKHDGNVVILQILGTWCPNCMDETAFLTKLHKQYKDDGLDVIAVTFEIPDTLEQKIERVKAFKKYFKAEYEFLIGGNADKQEAKEIFPVLSNISSFPTTVFIDRKGEIRRIHTGFYGPGTGNYYDRYVEDVQSFVGELLMEKEI